MLTAQSITCVLPNGRTLFSNLNFTLNRQKYGLVGSNGVGKSTLVRLIAKELQPTQGRLIGELRLHLLSQFEKGDESVTVGEYLLDIWDQPNQDAPLRESLLKGLNMESTLKTLSGGEWMRARLVKAIALSPELLILDEPTNNLDREGRECLYRFVQDFKDGLLIISHDRELLEYMEGIWELSNQGLAYYGGGFSLYEQQKQDEKLRLAHELDLARREKKKQEREHQEKLDRQNKRIRWANDNAESMGLPRIIVGSRKRQAQVSLGKIHKEESVRDMERAEKFQDLYKRQKQFSDLRLDFSLEKKAKGKVVFSLEDFNFRYPGMKTFLWERPLTFTLHAQERVAIRGGNGSGKTTLLRLLTSEQALFLGEHQGKLSRITRSFVYLDQNYTLLDPEKTVLENTMEESRLDLSEVRNKLADYGFYGDDVFKKCIELSGGERLRACLARLILSRTLPEVLILDEPTNNLDLESLEILEVATLKYPGTLIVVSHDESFLERIECGQKLNFVCSKRESW
ncbi:ABC-F family ATP-binding cassette domain-containing protein [Bdellovibrio sp. HCB337]|uniref:ABC-F family ATP-binding cassette domain-containing protein n=1 Tax=Bdellovibrio sp. HCB337 TaxID=3394358 RepID=UPI0039A5FEBE